MFNKSKKINGFIIEVGAWKLSTQQEYTQVFKEFNDEWKLRQDGSGSFSEERCDELLLKMEKLTERYETLTEVIKLFKEMGL